MFKFTIYFAISFAILCIPFGQGDGRIFDALYNYTRPYANDVVKTTKQKISLALKGKSFSEERCKNISNAITGRKIKNTQNMNKDKIGIPLSESHKNKISDSKKRNTTNRRT
jgi:hypothetical protein